MEDIDYYVNMINTMYTKIPEAEAELSDIETKVEEGRNELQSIKKEELKVVYESRNEKRLVDNGIQIARKNLADLQEAESQMQQTFDALVYRVNNIRYRAAVY
jgi:uncharacterized protein (DUF3084 family)